MISSGKYLFLGCCCLFVIVMAILAAHIAQRFLIIGVTAAAVRTRIQFDRPCTIGGDLSRNFRKLLLGIVAVNFLRLVLPGSRTWKDSSGLFVDLLGVVEVTGLTFLCFLTPYILETRLRNYISVPRPGGNFYRPLLGAVFLSCLGVVLSRSVHPNLWCLKKLANAMYVRSFCLGYVALNVPHQWTILRCCLFLTTNQIWSTCHRSTPILESCHNCTGWWEWFCDWTDLSNDRVLALDLTTGLCGGVCL